MTDNAMQYRVRRGGPWQTLLPGVYLSVLAEVADGIRSTAEGDLRDLVRAARLPMPLFNPSLFDGELFLGKPDGWWPDAGSRERSIRAPGTCPPTIGIAPGDATI
jgi:hypothetical protein